MVRIQWQGKPSHVINLHIRVTSLNSRCLQHCIVKTIKSIVLLAYIPLWYYRDHLSRIKFPFSLHTIVISMETICLTHWLAKIAWLERCKNIRRHMSHTFSFWKGLWCEELPWKVGMHYICLKMHLFCMHPTTKPSSLNWEIKHTNTC